MDQTLQFAVLFSAVDYLTGTVRKVAQPLRGLENVREYAERVAALSPRVRG